MSSCCLSRPLPLPLPRSSFDADVASKIFPASSLLTEKEIDTLSLSGSTISCSSSEAEEWTSTDEDDEEMSSEDGVEMSSEDGEEMSIEDDASDISESLSIGGKKEVVKDVTPTKVLVYGKRVQHFKNVRPRLKDWLNSWQKIEKTGFAWLNVYSYCNKGKGYSGYGVILRNNLALPFIAVTYFTQEAGVSQLLQLLNGLKIGLQLAVEYKCFMRVKVGCNVQKAVDILGSATFQESGDCFLSYRNSNHEKTDGICKYCTKRRALVKGTSLGTLIPVINELKSLQAKVNNVGFQFMKVTRTQNEAAHYLAKSAKDKGVEGPEVIQPAAFPHELKTILWEDAFGCKTMYSRDLILSTGS